MKNILGLITARGGSKGIPGKNIYPLAGKPLLSYTSEAAEQSKLLTKVVLSTDSPEIAEVGKRSGLDVPFLRPDKYSQDDTPSIDVVLHALDWLGEKENWIPDAVVLLQPTSPLRMAWHIDEGIELFWQHDGSTVVSVVKVPHRYSPYNVQRMENGMLEDFWNEEVSFNRYRRQDLPELYARNGPAVLITKPEVLIESKSFYSENVVPYIMDDKYSLDIDDMFDLQLAELMLGATGRKG